MGGQLQHFINTLVNIHHDENNQDICLLGNELIQIKYKSDHLNNIDDIAFDEKEWNDVKWDTLTNEEALLSISDKEPSREYPMMYLMQMDLQKLYKHLNEESNRLFNHIILQMMTINDFAPKTALSHFRSFMKTDLRSFGATNMRTVLPNATIKRIDDEIAADAWYMNEELDKYENEHLHRQPFRDDTIDSFTTQQPIKSINIHCGDFLDYALPKFSSKQQAFIEHDAALNNNNLMDYNYQMDINMVNIQNKFKNIKLYTMNRILSTQNYDDKMMHKLLNKAIKNVNKQLPKPKKIQIQNKDLPKNVQIQKMKMINNHWSKPQTQKQRIPNKKRKRMEFEKSNIVRDEPQNLLRCKKNHALNKSSVDGLGLNGYDWDCDKCKKTFVGKDIVYDCSKCEWGWGEQCIALKNDGNILKKKFDTNMTHKKIKKIKVSQCINEDTPSQMIGSKRVNKRSRRFIDSESDSDDDMNLSIKQEPE